MRNQIEFKTVEEYLASLPELSRKVLLELRECIWEVIPEATELINYNIPAYALVKGGKRDQQILIAGYAKHVGLYPSPSTIAHFWDRLDPYKRGKGSVQFPLNKPLPVDLIKEMLQYRKDMMI